MPVSNRLALLLSDHRVLTNQSDGLLFPGRKQGHPLAAQTLYRRLGAAWERLDLMPLGFHEARHTFASLMIAAGCNAKALATFMGHASITITYDRYGHLMPGAEHEAQGLLDAYLAREEG